MTSFGRGLLLLFCFVVMLTYLIVLTVGVGGIIDGR